MQCIICPVVFLVWMCFMQLIEFFNSSQVPSFSFSSSTSSLSPTSPILAGSFLLLVKPDCWSREDRIRFLYNVLTEAVLDSHTNQSSSSSSSTSSSPQKSYFPSSPSDDVEVLGKKSSEGIVINRDILIKEVTREEIMDVRDQRQGSRIELVVNNMNPESSSSSSSRSSSSSTRSSSNHWKSRIITKGKNIKLFRNRNQWYYLCPPLPPPPSSSSVQTYSHFYPKAIPKSSFNNSFSSFASTTTTKTTTTNTSSGAGLLGRHHPHHHCVLVELWLAALSVNIVSLHQCPQVDLEIFFNLLHSHRGKTTSCLALAEVDIHRVLVNPGSNFFLQDEPISSSLLSSWNLTHIHNQLALGDIPNDFPRETKKPPQPQVVLLSTVTSNTIHNKFFPGTGTNRHDPSSQTTEQLGHLMASRIFGHTIQSDGNSTCAGGHCSIQQLRVSPSLSAELEALNYLAENSSSTSAVVLPLTGQYSFIEYLTLLRLRSYAFVVPAISPCEFDTTTMAPCHKLLSTSFPSSLSSRIPHLISVAPHSVTGTSVDVGAPADISLSAGPLSDTDWGGGAGEASAVLGSIIGLIAEQAEPSMDGCHWKKLLLASCSTNRLMKGRIRCGGHFDVGKAAARLNDMIDTSGNSQNSCTKVDTTGAPTENYPPPSFWKELSDGDLFTLGKQAVLDLVIYPESGNYEAGQIGTASGTENQKTGTFVDSENVAQATTNEPPPGPTTAVKPQAAGTDGYQQSSPPVTSQPVDSTSTSMLPTTSPLTSSSSAQGTLLDITSTFSPAESVVSSLPTPPPIFPGSSIAGIHSTFTTTVPIQQFPLSSVSSTPAASPLSPSLFPKSSNSKSTTATPDSTLTIPIFHPPVHKSSTTISTSPLPMTSTSVLSSTTTPTLWVTSTLTPSEAFSVKTGSTTSLAYTSFRGSSSTTLPPPLAATKSYASVSTISVVSSNSRPVTPNAVAEKQQFVSAGGDQVVISASGGNRTFGADVENKVDNADQGGNNKVVGPAVGGTTSKIIDRPSESVKMELSPSKLYLINAIRQQVMCLGGVTPPVSLVGDGIVMGSLKGRLKGSVNGFGGLKHLGLLTGERDISSSNGSRNDNNTDGLKGNLKSNFKVTTPGGVGIDHLWSSNLAPISSTIDTVSRKKYDLTSVASKFLNNNRDKSLLVYFGPSGTLIKEEEAVTPTRIRNEIRQIESEGEMRVTPNDAFLFTKDEKELISILEDLQSLGKNVSTIH